MYPLAACRGKNMASGIVSWIVSYGLTDGTGDDFESYDEQDPVVDSLNAYSGWDGAWALPASYTGIQGMDTFDTYPLGTAVSLNDGFGWSGAWAMPESWSKLSGYDSMDTYNDGEA